MTFTNRQARALKAKLAHRHVKTRISNGASIAYVEGWHVIAEANRIFGYEHWDRTTLSPVCVWSELQRGQTVCFYSTRVRIRVRAGDIVVIRDGIGTGTGRSASPEQAHEIALKAAETDATKRALSTFGNPFGLALYDKDQAGVAKPPTAKTGDAAEAVTTVPASAIPPPLYALIMPGQPEAAFEQPQAFIAAALDRIPTLTTIEALYAFWEANVPTFSAVRRRASRRDDDPVGVIVTALKDRARQLGKRVDDRPKALKESHREIERAPARLALPKERRLRDKEHLAFVASQPCTICGRQPSHAHHLRFAQPRAMAMKVSDEFTLPLCAVHHDEVHRTGDERVWWAQRGKIEPLKIAAKLWEASRPGQRDLLAGPSHQDHTDTVEPSDTLEQSGLMHAADATKASHNVQRSLQSEPDRRPSVRPRPSASVANGAAGHAGSKPTAAE